MFPRETRIPGLASASPDVLKLRGRSELDAWGDVEEMRMPPVRRMRRSAVWRGACADDVLGG